MKRQYRLRRTGEIERVRQAGRSWSAGPVVLVAAQGLAAGPTRCAFICGKKVGDAVTRNRARRQLREVVRAAYPQIVPGWDLLWIARLSITKSDFGRIGTAVQDVLRRAQLLVPPTVAINEKTSHEDHRPLAHPPLPDDA